MITRIQKVAKIFKEWDELCKNNPKEEEKIRSSQTELGAIYKAFWRRGISNGNEAYNVLSEEKSYHNISEVAALQVKIFLAEGRDPELSNTCNFGLVRGLYERLYELTEDKEIADLLGDNFDRYLNNLMADHKKRFVTKSEKSFVSQNTGIGGRDSDVMHDLFAHGGDQQ